MPLFCVLKPFSWRLLKKYDTGKRRVGRKIFPLDFELENKLH